MINNFDKWVEDQSPKALTEAYEEAEKILLGEKDFTALKKLQEIQKNEN